MFEENEIKVSDICFSCRKKGFIAVRVVVTDIGLAKTRNRINICTNTGCFRHQKPFKSLTWIRDTPEDYAKAQSRYSANTVHDQREPRRPYGQRFAKAQDDGPPALDAAGPEIRQMEKPRPRRMHQGHERRTPSMESDDPKYRNEREAFWNKSKVKSGNGSYDTMET